jgi:hypothetical protein
MNHRQTCGVSGRSRASLEACKDACAAQKSRKAEYTEARLLAQQKLKPPQLLLLLLLLLYMQQPLLRTCSRTPRTGRLLRWCWPPPRLAQPPAAAAAAPSPCSAAMHGTLFQHSKKAAQTHEIHKSYILSKLQCSAQCCATPSMPGPGL